MLYVWWGSRLHHSFTRFKSVITLWQDLREYWCWVAMEETDKNLRANSTTTTSSGVIDGATAKSLASYPQWCSIFIGVWHRTRGACPCFFSWGMILSLLVHHKDIWPFPVEILLRQPRSPKPNLLPNLDRKSRKPRLPTKKRRKFLGYIMYYAETTRALTSASFPLNTKCFSEGTTRILLI